MKKVLGLFLVLATTVFLVSCNGKKEKLVVSKLYTASSMSNNAIELYNNSDKDIALADYTIDIYGNGLDEVSTSIQLEGTIKANDYYVIGSANFDEDEFSGVTEKFDLTLDKTIGFNGDDALTLKKKGKTIDYLGYTTGIAVNYSKNTTLIRIGNKEDYVANKEFKQFDFIQYKVDAFDYLKNDNHEIKTLEQIYKGPILEQRYKDLPYQDETGRIGTGGASVATLNSVADGDTATFTFDEKPVGSSSHRYYYIDTAEVSGPNTNNEPWGPTASRFNKEFLLNDAKNKTLHVQSVPGNGLFDTYNRNLGLIWVDGALSQFLIVAEGLSLVSPSFDETDMKLTYKDVPYLTFLVFAQERAKENGWGRHGFPSNPKGEKASDWDYNSNSPFTEGAKSWEPHLEINWNK